MIFFTWIDLAGTFAFALSGASAGIKNGFDVFGIFALSAVTAVGGGVIRDICIGAAPPAGLTNPAYLLTVILAVTGAMCFQKLFLRLAKPTLYLDAVGLGFFAAFGANKTWTLTHNLELAILMGCVSGVGGGVLRDLLSGKAPSIFSKEIYALAAIIGACIELLGAAGPLDPVLGTWAAILCCSAIRLLSLRYSLNLPTMRHLS